MNIKETVKNIGRVVTDEVFFRISDPEKIRAFSGHLSECSRTKFLQQSFKVSGPLPSWGSAGIGSEIESTTTACSECSGEIVQKLKH